MNNTRSSVRLLSSFGGKANLSTFAIIRKRLHYISPFLGELEKFTFYIHSLPPTKAHLGLGWGTRENGGRSRSLRVLDVEVSKDVNTNPKCMFLRCYHLRAVSINRSEAPEPNWAMAPCPECFSFNRWGRSRREARALYVSEAEPQPALAAWPPAPLLPWVS